MPRRPLARSPLSNRLFTSNQGQSFLRFAGAPPIPGSCVACDCGSAVSGISGLGTDVGTHVWQSTTQIWFLKVNGAPNLCTATGSAAGAFSAPTCYACAAGATMMTGQVRSPRDKQN